LNYLLYFEKIIEKNKIEKHQIFLRLGPRNFKKNTKNKKDKGLDLFAFFLFF